MVLGLFYVGKKVSANQLAEVNKISEFGWEYLDKIDSHTVGELISVNIIEDYDFIAILAQK